jgi:hypothetical protein
MDLARPAVTRSLLDREIMLRCLAEAADRDQESDFGMGRPARRMLELRLRTTASRRAAAMQRDDARAMRGGLRTEPAADRYRAMRHDLANGLLVLSLRRADLMVHCATAAELRSDAQALRAQAQQMQRHRRRPPA